MSSIEQQIERVLRAAPRPAPPAGLKEQLIAQVRLPAASAPATAFTPSVEHLDATTNFPLTPVLSPSAGERENLRQSVDKANASGNRERRTSILPLPRRGGEGRGEGAGRGAQPAVVLTRRGASSGWLRHWWPILLPGSVSLACAVALTIQQMEIRDLKQAIQDLTRESAAKARDLPSPSPATNNVPAGPDAAARTQQEIARLKGLAGQLGAEVAQLEQMEAENAGLRTQLAQPAAGSPTPEDADALAKAREKAESIACVNNLKGLRTGIKNWMGRNGNLTPPNMLSLTNHNFTPQQVDEMWASMKAFITSEEGSQVHSNIVSANITEVRMLSMSNSIYQIRDFRYIYRPLELVCPSDKGRQAARDWGSCTAANCSYSYLAPSAPATEPQQVLLLCPIHGHVALANGSVRSGVMKDHPEWLLRRDGKTYLAEPPHPSQGVPGFSDRLEGIINYRPTPVPETSTNPPPGGSNP